MDCPDEDAGYGGGGGGCEEDCDNPFGAQHYVTKKSKAPPRVPAKVKMNDKTALLVAQLTNNSCAVYYNNMKGKSAKYRPQYGEEEE